jgi:serine O-acetyltransferase
VTPGSFDPARLDDSIGRLTESILADPRTHCFNASALPDRAEVIAALDRLGWLMFPGLLGPRGVTAEGMRDHVIASVEDVAIRLQPQIAAALRYAKHADVGNPRDAERCAECDARATELFGTFVSLLPQIRRLLSLDVQAAFDGDPAARHTDEIVVCYPGIRALTVHRLSHALHRLGVPLLPRIMSEHSHSQTGIDIHPGANIGRSFFLDHGTGVVIGETAIIGDHCRIYQGVTLGAAFFEKDEHGYMRRGTKRHPTLEDHVTVYAGATILGGNTVIGAGSQINGGVFLTTSVPPGHVVRAPRIELTLRSNPDMPPSMYAI